MNPAAIVPVLDLSTCDQEPIRTPGSIQPHGFLLTLADDLAVLQADCDDAGAFIDQLRAIYSGDIEVGDIGAVIGTHAGRGTIGIAFNTVD